MKRLLKKHLNAQRSITKKGLQRSAIAVFTHPIGKAFLTFGVIYIPLSGFATSTIVHAHPSLSLYIAAFVGTLFILNAKHTHRTAVKASERQTTLLLEEIATHQHANKTLMHAREKAEAASLAKTRFLSGLSHEIRAPLNTIMGYAQILEADPRIPPDRLNTLRTIRESGDHMTALLGGLLDISRIEAGRIELYRDGIALTRFIESVVHMVSPQAAAKGLAFHYKSGRLPAMVNGDTHRLRQILLNLLSNAIKFTEQGSVTLTATWRNQIAEFVIEDTGPGIAAEHHERIFEPFERIAGDSVPGTGLGLTISRLLTEVLGGELTFTSSQKSAGHGTRFCVRLFLSNREEEAPQRLTQLPIAYLGSTRHILIVDDNPSHQNIMGDILASRGFTVDMAKNASECRKKLSASQPDLLLLDLSMPDMNGRDLALSLRKTQHDTIPILFVTGNMTELAAQRVPSLDTCPVLSKPVDFVTLFEAIGHLLDLQWQLPMQSTTLVAAATAATGSTNTLERPLSAKEAKALSTLVEQGNMRAFRSALKDLSDKHPEVEKALHPLREASDAYRLTELDRLLKSVAP